MTAPLSPIPSLDTLDAEALDWFVRKGRGLDPGEQAAFDAWLGAHPDRAAAMARWGAEWQALDALPASGIDHLRRQVAADRQAAGQAKASGATRLLDRLRAWMPRPALAAFSLCVSLCGFLVWQQWQQAPVFEQSFSTLRGQQSDVVLPDGSRIRLDTATRLDVTLYRQRREVRLIEGQAVFQVERDAGRRFDVMAGPVTVTVVGTRFSVRKVPGATGLHGVRVAVEEGRVRVAGPPHGGADGSGETVELQAGQQVAVRAGGRLEPVQPLAPGGMAPWREGRINFDNVPLGEALAEFERYGRTGLVVRDDKVAQMRLTGTFDPARLANFKLALPKVLPVRLRGDAGSTEIVAVP